MEKMETDIIVVAAGLSGLAAAISAAENGAGVLVLKSPEPQEAANMEWDLWELIQNPEEHMIS